MVKDFVVFEGLVTRVFPTFVNIFSQLVVHFRLLPDLLDHVVDVKNKDQLSFTVTIRNKLVRVQIDFVAEMVAKNVLECLTKLLLSQVLVL